MRTSHLLIVINIIVSIYHSNGDNLEPKTLKSDGENMNEDKTDVAVVYTSNDDENGKVEDGEIFVETEEDFTLPNVFQPTKEWKTIREDEAIPAGLHVRMNLATGEKQAKLMEEEDDVMREGSELEYWKSGDRQGMKSSGKTFTSEELKHALKEFKEEVQSEEEIERKKKKETLKKFRSYEELKLELSEFSGGIKTDAEIMSSLLETYQLQGISNDDKILILDKLEYLVHQVDNGVDFIKLGGLDIVKKDLNSSTTNLVSSTLHVLGSAAQSNPRVQASAINQGMLHHSLHILSQTIRTLLSIPGIASDEDVKLHVSLSTLLSRAVFCLGALIRHFPSAQSKLLELGGLSALTDINHLPSTNANMKYKIKVASLLYDIIADKISHASSSDNQKKMFEKVDIVRHMIDQGWCDISVLLLGDCQDVDHQEKVLRLMTHILDPCLEQSASSAYTTNLFNILNSIYYQVREKSKDEDEGEVEYYQTVLDIVRPLKERVERIEQRDEL